MATADKQITFRVTQTPAWFTSITQLVVTDLAGGPGFGSAFQQGATLRSVQPTPYTMSGVWGPDSIIIPWTGGAVSQSLGEYYKMAEGGHGDGSDHCIYILSLKQDVPAWIRGWGPNSPGGNVPALNTAHCATSSNCPITAHGYWWRQVTEGPEGVRLWLLGSNENSGLWTTDIWSIARSSLGAGVTTASLWVYHGRAWTSLPSSCSYEYGPSGWDSIANQLITMMGFADSNGVRRIDVPTAVAAGNQSFSGPQVPGSTLYSAGLGGNPGTNSWSVMCTNTSPRCFAFGSPNDNALYVWNLESPGTFRTKTVTGGTISSTSTCGAGYNSANRKIVIGGPTLGSTLRTITIPTDLWNASSPLTMSSLSLSGSFGTVGSFQGMFSGGRLIEDMGNGQSCFVGHTRATTSPTQVIKLPAVF